MCVIISIYNNNKDKTKNDFLEKCLQEYQQGNVDGTAFFGYDSEKELKHGYLRELKPCKNLFGSLLEKYNIGHYHFRQATSGLKNIDNLHLWKYKNWVMAHNGVVYDEDNGGYLSDSNLFFKGLSKAGCFDKDYLDINKINKIVCKKHFWGRLLFVNTDNKQVYYFGDFILSVVNNDILVVSTKKLASDVLDLYGIRFETQNKDIIQANLDGIFRIDSKKQIVKKYKLEFNKKDYSEGYKTKYVDPYVNYDLEDKQQQWLPV